MYSLGVHSVFLHKCFNHKHQTTNYIIPLINLDIVYLNSGYSFILYIYIVCLMSVYVCMYMYCYTQSFFLYAIKII